MEAVNLLSSNRYTEKQIVSAVGAGPEWGCCRLCTLEQGPVPCWVAQCSRGWCCTRRTRQVRCWGGGVTAWCVLSTQGYLFISVLVNSNSELIRLINNAIKNDLASRNPTFMCLALHCIANVGSREMGEAFAADIPRILVAG